MIRSIIFRHSRQTSCHVVAVLELDILLETENGDDKFWRLVEQCH